MSEEYFKNNQALWDGWARQHQKSSFYGVSEFKAGETTLRHVELTELTGVRGQTLLHLQCHFGLDTLSWAREGAKVTGVDFSEEAIAGARKLSAELALPAQFVRSNIYDLPKVLDGEFDIVFTSYGVLTWLPDIKGWAEIVAHFLKPGGRFYMVEFHPLASMLSDDGTHFEFPYFHHEDPVHIKSKGSYGAPESEFEHDEYEWFHSLGDVVSALVAAGLRIHFLHEFPYSAYDCYPYLKRVDEQRYVVKQEGPTLPLMYSILAEKP